MAKKNRPIYDIIIKILIFFVMSFAYFNLVDTRADATAITSIRNSDSEESYYTLTIVKNRLYIEGKTINEVNSFFYAFYTPIDYEYVTLAQRGTVIDHFYSQELLLPMENGALMEGTYQLYLDLEDAKCSPCITVTNGQIGLYQSEYFEQDVRADTFLQRLNRDLLQKTNALHKYHSSRSDMTITGSQREELLTFARSITTGITKDYDKVEVIYQWITENIYYDQDAFEDQNGNNNPYWVFRNKRSVCEGYTRLMVELLNLMDIPSAVVIGDAGTAPVVNDVDSNHAWVAVYADSRWFYTDPTWDSQNRYEKGVFTKKANTSQYFDVTLEAITATHCNEYIEGAIEVGDFEVTFYDGALTVETYKGTKSYIQLPDEVYDMQITQVIGYFIEAFNYKVKGIVVPEGYRTLYNSAFQRYPELEYIILPDTIEDIQDNAFYNSEDNLTICNVGNKVISHYAQENDIVMLDKEPNLINEKEKFNISDARIATIENITYAGEELQPRPVITYQDKTLRHDIDYTLIYKNNDKSGQAYVTILGMGNYDGVKVKTYNIIPQSVSVKLTKLSKNKAKAYWKDSPGATGYEIQYSLKERGTYQTIGFHQSLNCVIERLEPGYVYYFKIRPYVYIGTQIYYGAYSKVASIKM